MQTGEVRRPRGDPVKLTRINSLPDVDMRFFGDRRTLQFSCTGRDRRQAWHDQFLEPRAGWLSRRSPGAADKNQSSHGKPVGQILWLDLLGLADKFLAIGNTATLFAEMGWMRDQPGIFVR